MTENEKRNKLMQDLFEWELWGRQKLLNECSLGYYQSITTNEQYKEQIWEVCNLMGITKEQFKKLLESNEQLSKEDKQANN